MLRDRFLAQGLSDIAAAVGGKSDSIQKGFKQYLDSVFPFRASDRSTKDDEMRKVMKREVDKGAITFQPVPMDFLKTKAKTMQVSDEWSARLRRAAQKKGLR